MISNKPVLVNDDDPDVEGQYIGDELHSLSCPCLPCKAENDRIDVLVEACRPKTPEDIDAWLDATAERERKRQDRIHDREVKEAWTAWSYSCRRGEDIELWRKLGMDIPKALAATWDQPDYGIEREELGPDDEIPEGYFGPPALDDHTFILVAALERAEVDAIDLRALRHTLPLVAGDLTPVPALLTRSDGATLLYRGRLNSIFGEPGGGKTWGAIMATIEAVRNGARVVWWDFDDRPATLAARLIALRAGDLIEGGQLLYATPDLKGDDEEIKRMGDWMERGRSPGLVVIDSVESAGLPTDSNNAAPWFETHVSPFLARDIGVLNLDHVPKRREDRPKGAIGSQHKRARLSGAGLLLAGAPWTKTQGGKVKLVNHKDRLGDLPAPDGKTVAIISVTHGENGRLNYSIDAPSAEENTEDVTGLLLEAIAAEGPEGVRTMKNIRGLLNVGHKKLDPALDDCLNNGWVKTDYDGKANVYTVTPEGEKMLGVGLE